MASSITSISDRFAPLDMSVYLEQIYKTLQTLTIKYDPLIDAMTNVAAAKGYSENESDTANRKYYLNLMGQYSPSDTMMTIISLDTQQEMDFTVENLAKSPQTLNLYVPGSTYYDALCSKYPDQTDLIKSIRYPVTDLQAAIDAPSLTRLMIDTSFLELNERDVIVDAIDNALALIAKRWYSPIYNYEPYFPWIFLGMVFQSLASVCIATRVQYIRRAEVHSFHIWEYLVSNGLDDYSDLLTDSQARWLYRNLDYIFANQGKQSNLILLAENLLAEFSLTLRGRYVLNEAQTRAGTYQLTPLFMTETIPLSTATDAVTSPETMLVINDKLIAAGKEHDSSTQYVTEQEDTLAGTTVGSYPTKLLEIALIPKDLQYAELFNTYIWEMAIYAITQQTYGSQVTTSTPDGQYDLILDPKDALVLLFYCLTKSQNIDPTDQEIPEEYPFFLATPPGSPTIPRYAYYQGQKIIIRGLVPLSAYTQDLDMTYQISSPTDLSNLIYKGFSSLASQMDKQRINCDANTEYAMKAVSQLYLVNKQLPLDLCTETTYGAWLKDRLSIVQDLINNLDNEPNSIQAYGDYAQTLLRQIVPITKDFSQFGEFTISEGSYQRLIKLFTQLTSYNVAFVYDDIGPPKYIETPHVSTAYDMSLSIPDVPVDISPRGVMTEHLTYPEDGPISFGSTWGMKQTIDTTFCPLPTLTFKDDYTEVFRPRLQASGEFISSKRTIVMSSPIGDLQGHFTVPSVS